MAPPTCALPNLAPYMAVTTYVPGMFEHNSMRAEGSEQCTRPASSSPFEPTIRFDNPVSEFLSLFAHFEPEQSEVMCASTHTTSQVMEHALQSAPEAALGRVASPPRGVGPACAREFSVAAEILFLLGRPRPSFLGSIESVVRRDGPTIHPDDGVWVRLCRSMASRSPAVGGALLRY